MIERYIFRAKRLDCNQWTLGSLVYSVDSNEYFIRLLNYDIEISINQETIYQCTGTRDSCNILLFEGDIVSVREDETYIIQYSTKYHEMRLIPYNKKAIKQVINAGNSIDVGFAFSSFTGENTKMIKVDNIHD